MGHIVDVLTNTMFYAMMIKIQSYSDILMLPWPLDTFKGFKLDIGADPAILRHLAAGDATRAFVLASRRLAAAGVRSAVRTCVANRNTARLWAAALAFPITGKTARLFLNRLDPSKE